MKSMMSCLTQSKYFSPAFNGAIFDGPIRIYFAQYQENEALHLYFWLQKHLQQVFPFTDRWQRSDRWVFVMIYPSADIFDRSFDGCTAEMARVRQETWEDDLVIGLQAPFAQADLDAVAGHVEKLLQRACLAPVPAISSPSEDPSPVSVQ